jgi:hypothetical protein
VNFKLSHTQFQINPFLTWNPELIS